MASGAACFRQQLVNLQKRVEFLPVTKWQPHLAIRITHQLALACNPLVPIAAEIQQGFCDGAQANHVHVSAPALSAQQRRIELPVLVYPGAAIDGHLVAAVRVHVIAGYVCNNTSDHGMIEPLPY